MNTSEQDGTPVACPEKQKKKHNLLQWRPKEPTKINTRTAFYSPARDLAYVGPEVVKRAMQALRTESWEPWLKAFLDAHGISEDTLIETEAPRKLALAMNQIIRAETPPKALEDSGFAALSAEIQLLFYARIGQVFLAALWSAVKDTHAPDDTPPPTIEDILAATETALPEQVRENV
jgi:hypothetical protein